MSDFDSNPFADPDFSNPFQVANLAFWLTYAKNLNGIGRMLAFC